MFGTIQLEDARTLQQCDITDGSQLNMLFRLRGGMERFDDDDVFMPDTPGGAGSAGPPAPLPIPPVVVMTEVLKTMTEMR